MKKFSFCFLLVLLTASASFATTCTTTISTAKCTVGNLCVELSWTAPTGFPIAGYNIYRGTTAGGENLLTPINSSLITGTTYEDDNVAFGTTEFYVAETVELGGWASGISNETCSQTPVTPTPPTGFTSSPAA